MEGDVVVDDDDDVTASFPTSCWVFRRHFSEKKEEVTTVAAECHFERVIKNGVREEMSLKEKKNTYTQKKSKTNTESAASSSSNQSSVMGNAGLGVCARL